MKKIVLQSFFVFFCMLTLGFSAKAQQPEIEGEKIVIRFKEDAATPASQRQIKRQQLMNKMGAKRQELFIKEKPRSGKSAVLRQKEASSRQKYRLNDLYQIEVAAVTPALLKALNNDPSVAYAEPVFKYAPFHAPSAAPYMPNDTNLNSQYYLGLINAFEAWGITQGSAEIVVAITDSGIDFNHPELAGKSWVNSAELNGSPGIDDDGNGYIDDIYGYDVADRDNDITPIYNHGMQVSGIVGANTNNAAGMAGVGFNTTLMGVKIAANANGSYDNTFEAVIYAAENGADVINMSWGRNGIPSRYEQEVINYLVETYDVVLVAAAGNTRANLSFFPASYEHVISVSGSTFAQTNILDKERWFNTTYGYYTDILAPGEYVYSVATNNGYRTESGTSFAAPIVSAAAALVKAYAPSLSATQIGELLRVSADRSVYAIGSNAQVQDLLGYGHLDIANALQQKDNLSAIRMKNLDYVSGTGGRKVLPGDQVTVTADFINHLAAASNLTVTLSEVNNAVTITQPTFSASSLGTGQTLSNSAAPFTFTVPAEHVATTALIFKLSYSYNGGTEDYQFFQIELEPYQWDVFNDGENQYNVTINNITFGHDADGRFGKTGTYGQNRGVGFKYNGGANLLNEGGLLLATNATTVSDPIRTSGGAQNSDFTLYEKPLLHEYETAPYLSMSSQYEDYSTNGVGVRIYEKITGWYNDADDDYLLVEYNLTNLSGAALPSFYAGIYTDWNLSGTADFTAFDSNFQFGYTYDPVAGQYVGLKVLNANRQFYAIDLDATTTNANLVVTDGFTDAEKFQSVSSGIGRSTAGGQNGNDVAMVSGTHFTNVANGQTVRFAVIVAYATSLSELRNNMEKGSLNAGTFNNSWAAVGNLTTTVLSSTSVRVQWNDLGLQEHYLVLQRATDANFSQNLHFFSLPANSTFYTDSNLTAGTTYYYRVVGKKED